MDVLYLTRQLLERFSISDFLPYYAYDRDRGFYALSQGVGFVYECSQVWGGSTTADSIKGLLYQEFPPGTSLQFTLFASKNIAPMLDAYVQLREQSQAPAVLKEVIRKKRQFMLEGTEKSILKGYDFRVRTFRHFVSCVVPAKPTPDGYEEGFRSCLKIKPTVYQALNTAHLAPVECPPESLVEILTEILNPGHEPGFISYDERIVIRDQLVYADSEIEVEKDYMVIDGKYVRTFTVRQYPERWDISETVNYVGSLFDNVRQIPTRFLVTLNVEYPDKVKALDAVERRGLMVSYQLFGPMAKWFPELGEKKRHIDAFIAKVRSGDAPVYAYLCVVLFADSLEELEAVSTICTNLYRSLGFILQVDRYIMLPVFLQALPMAYQREAKPELRRMKTLKAQDVAELAPTASDWPGFGLPVLMLVSRRGQLQFFDVFRNPQGGFSGVVVASTGAGKSFFVNELIVSYLSIGAKIWVIDVGRSYEKLCSFCGGTFMVFDLLTGICINPFTNVRNLEEELPILKSIVAQMCSSTPLDETAKAFIEEAIKEVYLEKGNRMTVTDVAAYLGRQTDQVAKTLARRLYPYTKDGAYASFFEGEANIRTETDFVVMELEELKSKKDLQEVVLLTLIYQIQQAMVDREAYKMLIIDEAWDLLRGGNTTDFMETAYRRFRKYRGACFSITQSVNDFYRIPAGVAIIENSDFMFLLRQRPESIKMLKESGRVFLSDGLYELLTSVHTDQGNYSEIFVYTPVGVTVSRLVVDRFTQLLYTSKAEEYLAVKKYMEAGLSVSEAIEKVIEDETRGR